MRERSTPCCHPNWRSLPRPSRFVSESVAPTVLLPPLLPACVSGAIDHESCVVTVTSTTPSCGSDATTEADLRKPSARRLRSVSASRAALYGSPSRKRRNFSMTDLCVSMCSRSASLYSGPWPASVSEYTSSGRMVMVPIRRDGSVCALSAAATAKPRIATRTDFTGCDSRVTDWSGDGERFTRSTRKGGEKICYPARHTNPRRKSLGQLQRRLDRNHRRRHVLRKVGGVDQAPAPGRDRAAARAGVQAAHRRSLQHGRHRVARRP